MPRKKGGAKTPKKTTRKRTVKKLTIEQELHRIQQELNVPKGQYNSYANFKYRSLEDIVEAYKKVAGPTTLVFNDKIIKVGARYYIQSTASLMIDGGENGCINNEAVAREQEKKTGMDQAQITGATSTYARKYALNGLFAIDDTKDADSMDNKEIADNKKTVTQNVPPAGMTVSQLKNKIDSITDINELTELFKPFANGKKEIVDLFVNRQQQLLKKK